MESLLQNWKMISIIMKKKMKIKGNCEWLFAVADALAWERNSTSAAAAAVHHRQPTSPKPSERKYHFLQEIHTIAVLLAIFRPLSVVNAA